ncbi:MAG: GlcG/HbpS family heme-binding protein, partial [Thermoguttaceae bacterium]
FDMPTGEIGKLSQPGGALFNIEHSNNGLITFPGGVPLKDKQGGVIGAIGVSGSTVENDHLVATAGAAAVE